MAQHTIIFLGPFSPRCYSIMVSKGAYGVVSLDNTQDAPDTSGVHDQAEAVEEGHIHDNPWFRRVWVFQELVLSVDLWVQCGRVRIRWDSFCKLVVPSFCPSDNGRLISAMIDTRNRNRGGDQGRNRGFIPDLFGLLLSRSGAEATDPRDIIYGHLSLVKGSESYMSVNYNKSLSEVFEEVAHYYVEWAHHYVEWTRDLSILRYVELKDPDERREHLPSWVPDWTVQKDVPFRHELRYFKDLYAFLAPIISQEKLISDLFLNKASVRKQKGEISRVISSLIEIMDVLHRWDSEGYKVAVFEGGELAPVPQLTRVGDVIARAQYEDGSFHLPKNVRLFVLRSKNVKLFVPRPEKKAFNMELDKAIQSSVKSKYTMKEFPPFSHKLQILAVSHVKYVMPFECRWEDCYDSASDPKQPGVPTIFAIH
jgi:hypothetical protein